ncbi:hypothetical protein [Microbacterium aurum]
MPTRSREAALDGALRHEPDAADVVVGLATVSRLLAIELAAATGSTKGAVLEGLGARTIGCSTPEPCASDAGS